MITVKHIYEIAKIKAADKCLVGVPLKVSHFYLEIAFEHRSFDVLIYQIIIK